MIDTTVFSIFHRAPPATPSREEPQAAAPAEAIAPIAEDGDAPPPPEDPAPAPVELTPVLDTLPEPPAPALEPAHEPPPVALETAPEPEPALAERIVDLAPPAEPPAATTPHVLAELPADSAPTHWQCGGAAEHQLIGLANPIVFTVIAALGDAPATELTAAGTGLYRPRGFRAAPWSGFAYDAAPDNRIGLLAGTRVLTARGEVPVEQLLPGDAVLALRGPALLPIIWIGRTAAAEPSVRIEAGALGPDRPTRPLCVAADHPVFVDPVPVPARQLVNGTTVQLMASGAAELFQVDVGTPEVLFADGVPIASTRREAGPGTPAP